MPIEITMPRLSDTMESGTILKWNVSEGDSVSSGDAVADIETDKATMEMQVYDDGTLAKILVNEGESVGVGTVIALLAEEGEDVKEAASASSNGSAGKSKAKASDDDADDADEPSDDESEKDESDDQQEKDDEKDEKVDEKDAGSSQRKSAEPSDEPKQEQRTSSGRMRISPVAQRLADDNKVDLKSIQGSGPSGRIIKRDVLKAIEAGEETAAAVAPSAKRDGQRPSAPITRVGAAQVSDETDPGPLEARTIQLSNMRQTIAKRLVESKTTIPHYQVTVTFAMDALLELRKSLNEQLAVQRVKLSVNDFLVRACALSMHQHHEFNASWTGDGINVHGEVNVGIAISMPAERGGGLVVATIRHADEKGLRTISAESKSLAEKARSRGLSIDEMSDSTFTLSNLGMFGVDNFTAIINPPNSAILAVGAALEKPVVRNHQLVVGHEMSATLSCDHRIIDGAMAAEYLQTLKQFIENPGTLLV